MKLSKSNFKAYLYSEKSAIITIFSAVLIWGLAAHAYGMLSPTLSHDLLNEFYVSERYILHKIELGRFAVLYYQMLFHGRVTLPWLSGLLSFFGSR